MATMARLGKSWIIKFLFFLGLTLSASAASGAELKAFVQASGGPQSSASYQLWSVVGEPSGGASTSSSYTVTHSFLAEGGTYVSGNITSNTTWTLAASPYILTSSVTVSNNATLTIQPGVEIRAMSGVGITIGPGTLIARGTAAQPIKFTTNNATPAAGQWYGIYLSATTAATILDYCTIEYAGASWGAALVVNSSTPIIQHCTMRNNASYPMSLYSIPTLSGNTYTGNGIQAIELAGLNYNTLPITTSATIPFIGIPYILTSFVTVSNNATLTIQPGVEIRAMSGVGITIGSGTLMARGTATQPIKFTTDNATPAAGQWSGINLYTTTATTVLDYCTIEYAGAGSKAALGIYSSIPVIQHCTIRNNAGYPVSLHSIPTLSGNTYIGNGIQAIELIGAYLTTSATIPFDGLPYILTSSVTVSNNATLTIQPGVEIRAAGIVEIMIGYYYADNAGTLIARGTAAQPIKFTTNSATPAAGQWSGINLYWSTEATVLDYCTIEYAGAFGRAALEVNSSTPVIQHCTIRNNAKAGIKLSGGHPTIELTTVSANDQGIEVSTATGFEQTRNNSITGNANGGLVNNSGGGLVARLNWWGDASGPSGIGPGSGSSITGNVLFEPWLGQVPSEPFRWMQGLHSSDSFTQAGGSTTFSATLTQAGNWMITIRNLTNTVVKTFSGTGAKFSQDWFGNSASASPLPNGIYKFQLDATSSSTGQTAAPALGAVTLNNVLPIAKITAPTPDQVVTGSVNIVGTAGGLNFQSYTVEVGAGNSPSYWSLLASSNTSVTNGSLATWNTTSLTTSPYKLRLTVTSTTNQTAVELVTVRVLNVYNLYAYPNYFSPNGDGQQDTATIYANFTLPVNWTLTIKNSANTIVKTLTGTNQSGVSQIWDGTNASNVKVLDGIYTYQIQGTEPTSRLIVSSNIGSVTVDTTLPTAAITSPTQNQVVLTDNPLLFVGTAADTNFLSATISYGIGIAPSSFTFLGDVSQTTNGVLYALSTSTLIKYFSPATYTFRLIVTDLAGNVSQFDRVVIFDYITVTNVVAAPQIIDPYKGEMAAITYTLSKPADVTINFYEEQTKQLVKKLTFLGRTAGVNTASWNGKNNAGVIVPLEKAYYFTITATDAGGRRGTYNDAASPLPGVFNFSVLPAINSTRFDPFKNDLVQISYTLLAPGRIPTQITTSGWIPVRTLFSDQVIQAPGKHLELWDGRRDDGTFYQGAFSVLFGFPSSFPENAVTLRRTLATFTNFRANAYLIQPLYAEVSQFTYTLTQNATVSVTITDPNGNVVRQLVTNLSQSAGAQSLEWDGRTDSGQIVALPGSYRVMLTAVDPTTGLSSIWNGSVVVYQ